MTVQGPAPGLVRAIEEMSLRALPGLSSVHHDGWVATFAEGVTGRANCITALNPGPSGVDDIAEAFEPAYAARGLTPLFRVSPLCPTDSVTVLRQRGYTLGDRVVTEVASVLTGFVRAGNVSLAPISDQAWLTAYCQAARPLDERGRQVLSHLHALIPAPKVFARITHDDRVVATGYAVAEHGWVSLHEISTDPAHRRRGLARSLVETLVAWGQMQGARHAWLHVTHDNSSARHLYRRLGFEPLYEYEYWRQQPAVAAPAAG